MEPQRMLWLDGLERWFVMKALLPARARAVASDQSADGLADRLGSGHQVGLRANPVIESVPAKPH
jgi:hypothetical protein